jgi:hypothetical protein
LFDALLLITAMVNAIIKFLPLQGGVYSIGLPRPTLFSFGLFVPVDGGNRAALVLLLFRVVDFLALWVQNVLFSLLFAPLAVSQHRPHGQHDMRVWISILLIVSAYTLRSISLRKPRTPNYRSAASLA